MWRFWFWLGDGGWAWWRRRPYFVEGPLPENATFAEDIKNNLVGNQTIDSLEGDDLGDLGNGGVFANITRSETLKYGSAPPVTKYTSADISIAKYFLILSKDRYSLL